MVTIFPGKVLLSPCFIMYWKWSFLILANVNICRRMFYCHYLHYNSFLWKHIFLITFITTIFQRYFYVIHASFISSTFISNARLKLAKNQTNTKEHPEVGLFLFENYSLSSSTLLSKNKRRYSKKCIKNKYVYLNKVVWLMIQPETRYNMKRPRSRHGHKYTKYKMSLSIMLVVCIKQHLGNIWSSMHEKVKQHWRWAKKSFVSKKACNYFSLIFSIWDALRDLVPFVQFKKREKHLWRSVTFSKVVSFAKSSTPLWVFFMFFKFRRIILNRAKHRKCLVWQNFPEY